MGLIHLHPFAHFVGPGSIIIVAHVGKAIGVFNSRKSSANGYIHPAIRAWRVGMITFGWVEPALSEIPSVGQHIAITNLPVMPISQGKIILME